MTNMDKSFAASENRSYPMIEILGILKVKKKKEAIYCVNQYKDVLER